MALPDWLTPVRLSEIKLAAGSGSNYPNRPDLDRAARPAGTLARAAAAGRHGAFRCKEREREGESSPWHAGARGGHVGEGGGVLELRFGSKCSPEKLLRVVVVVDDALVDPVGGKITGPCQEGAQGEGEAKAIGGGGRGHRHSPETAFIPAAGSGVR